MGENQEIKDAYIDLKGKKTVDDMQKLKESGETFTPVGTEKLTLGQKELAQSGTCPHCQMAMTPLKPANAPKASEHYCGSCHFSWLLDPESRQYRSDMN